MLVMMIACACVALRLHLTGHPLGPQDMFYPPNRFNLTVSTNGCFLQHGVSPRPFWANLNLASKVPRSTLPHWTCGSACSFVAVAVMVVILIAAVVMAVAVAVVAWFWLILGPGW